ncbi:hypothetical protein [Kordiimonas aestuarii]|uniref:hypothetical protein n=1 Tax=Kordiimonas aestuarii TaxID=1005925 RepID=UPI0021D1EC5A|nr:hypothetical protein [Kordiimonas aestuarii]
MSKDQPALSAKHATIILQFLQRTQLQGAEMPAFVEVCNSLSTIAKPAEKPPQDTADTWAPEGGI